MYALKLSFAIGDGDGHYHSVAVSPMKGKVTD
jgi:hypothetical protein